MGIFGNLVISIFTLNMLLKKKLKTIQKIAYNRNTD